MPQIQSYRHRECRTIRAQPPGFSLHNDQLLPRCARTRYILHRFGGWVMKALTLPLGFLLLPHFSSAQTPSSGSAPKTDECKIRGMVVKLAGSEPLRKARVQLQSADDGTRGTSVVTDASGRFQFKGVEPGRYKLIVT